MLSPRIETKRLILRRYKESDIDAIYEMITDDRLSKYIKYPKLTKEIVNELIEDINLFFDILESAFAPDIRMAFNGSIELAILSGVPSEEEWKGEGLPAGALYRFSQEGSYL